MEALSVFSSGSCPGPVKRIFLEIRQCTAVVVQLRSIMGHTFHGAAIQPFRKISLKALEARCG